MTLPERFDFFLVSQSVRQGTVNPTSYNVLRNTHEDVWTPKILQVGAIKLCRVLNFRPVMYYLRT